MIWAYKASNLDANTFINQLWNPVTVQQLTILRYDLFTIPYELIQQRITLIDKQFDYNKPIREQNQEIQNKAKETSDHKKPEDEKQSKTPEKQTTIE